MFFHHDVVFFWRNCFFFSSHKKHLSVSHSPATDLPHPNLQDANLLTYQRIFLRSLLHKHQQQIWTIAKNIQYQAFKQKKPSKNIQVELTKQIVKWQNGSGGTQTTLVLSMVSRIAFALLSSRKVNESTWKLFTTWFSRSSSEKYLILQTSLSEDVKIEESLCRIGS